jgi:hypothetical protein
VAEEGRRATGSGPLATGAIFTPNASEREEALDAERVAGLSFAEQA